MSLSNSRTSKVAAGKDVGKEILGKMEGEDENYLNKVERERERKAEDNADEGRAVNIKKMKKIHAQR